MHEVGMMANLLSRAVERAKEEGAKHIRLVQVRVGEASGVVPASLELAFDVVKKGTIAADAQLQINWISTVCYCTHCDENFTPANLLNECPQCHQITADIRHGKEFDLEFLEVS